MLKMVTSSLYKTSCPNVTTILRINRMKGYLPTPAGYSKIVLMSQKLRSRIRTKSYQILKGQTVLPKWMTLQIGLKFSENWDPDLSNSYFFNILILLPQSLDLYYQIINFLKFFWLHEWSIRTINLDGLQSYPFRGCY